MKQFCFSGVLGVITKVLHRFYIYRHMMTYIYSVLKLVYNTLGLSDTL